jgi:hypothetical protein
MDCEERALRDMLGSVYGDGVGQCILDKAQSGEPIVIAMEDGSIITLSSVGDALRVLLERFGWRKGPAIEGIDWRTDQIAAWVLGVCRRVEKHFTLQEVVARISMERPEMILEFASAWGRLIRGKYVRLLKKDEPCLYEVLGNMEAV